MPMLRLRLTIGVKAEHAWDLFYLTSEIHHYCMSLSSLSFGFPLNKNGTTFYLFIVLYFLYSHLRIKGVHSLPQF